MFPVYGYMDPYTQTYPHQRQNYYPSQYHPNWESMPSQIRADTVKHPFVVVPPSTGSNFPHPAPFDQNGCCHQNCSPCHYGFRPSFSSPQPFFYQPYPPYPNTYPPYFVPPPHYPTDQAQYDYDKTRNHCCGCPNHTCGRREDTSLKIEEQKPDQDESSSLIKLPNYSNPVVWVPRPYLKEKDDEKASELQPGQRTGSVPIDMNSLKNLNQDSEAKKEQQVGDKTAHKYSPFPIIWMPGHDKSMGGTKDVKEITPNSVEHWPSMFKIVPMDRLENEDRAKKLGAIQDVPQDQVQPKVAKEKESKIRTIPVKKLEENCQKQINTLEKPEEKIDETKNTTSEKQKKNTEVRMVPEKKQSSPVRSSKLPPVCLRVDPLPRKKGANGTSRSPSPPGRKDEYNEKHGEDRIPRKETRELIPEKDVRVVEVKDQSSNQEEKEQEEHSSENSIKEKHGRDLKNVEVTEGSKVGEKKNSENGTIADKEKTVEVKGCGGSSVNKHVELKKGRIREFSQEDAAVAIQSAYRGYEVRRLQPLEKLRKIAKIREQVGSIRDQIWGIEASSKGWDAKQRVAIGETIMNLLLQLDTIQGLHPSIREIRKSVAKELICLQERLDSIGAQLIQEHEPATAEVVVTAHGEPVGDNSCSVTVPSAEHEPSKESIDITEIAASTNQPAHVEEETLPETPTGEVATTIPVATEQVYEHRPLQQVEGENTETVNQPAQVEGEVLADESTSDEVVMTVCSSPITEERIYDHESMQRVKGENNAEDKPPAESVGYSEVACEQDDMDLSPATVSFPSASLPNPEQDTSHRAQQSNGSEDLSVEVKEASSEEEKFGDRIDGKSEATGLSSMTAVASEVLEDFANLGTDVEEPGEPHQKVKNQGKEAGDQEVSDSVAADSAQTDKEDVELQSELEEAAAVKAEEPQRGVDEDVRPVNENKSEMESFTNESGNMTDWGSDMQRAPAECVVVDVHCEDADDSCPQVDVKLESAERVVEDLEESKAGNETYSVGVGDLIDKYEVADEARVPQSEVLPFAESETTDVAPDELTPHTNVNAELNDEGKKLLEENQKLREMLEKLLEAGKEQLGTITNLSGRVKDLERKLAQKKRVKMRRNKAIKSRSCEVSC